MICNSIATQDENLGRVSLLIFETFTFLLDGMELHIGTIILLCLDSYIIL